MPCGCKKGKKPYKIQLAGGLVHTKNTEAEALAFAAKNPGSRVIAPTA